MEGPRVSLRDYERWTHNCLEHAYLSQESPENWRCKHCIRRVPKPNAKLQSLFDADFAEVNEWFKIERRNYRIYANGTAYLASYSSTCPECERYIVRNNSWIVELSYKHPNQEPTHWLSYDTHYVEGKYVHFDCFKEMLRQRPCFYCGETPAGTIDHVIPTSRGGKDEPFNLVAACTSCNSSKGARNQTVHILHKEMPEKPNEDWLAA